MVTKAREVIDVAFTAQQDGITVVATTNVPDRLDDAALSRFTVIPVLFGSAEEVDLYIRAIFRAVPLSILRRPSKSRRLPQQRLAA